MDRMGANFYRTRDMVVSNLGANPLVIQLPIGQVGRRGGQAAGRRGRLSAGRGPA